MSVPPCIKQIHIHWKKTPATQKITKKKGCEYCEVSLVLLGTTLYEMRQEDWEEKSLKTARSGAFSTMMKALLEQVICQIQEKRTDKIS